MGWLKIQHRWLEPAAVNRYRLRTERANRAPAKTTRRIRSWLIFALVVLGMCSVLVALCCLGRRPANLPAMPPAEIISYVAVCAAAFAIVAYVLLALKHLIYWLIRRQILVSDRGIHVLFGGHGNVSIVYEGIARAELTDLDIRGRRFPVLRLFGEEGHSFVVGLGQVVSADAVRRCLEEHGVRFDGGDQDTPAERGEQP